MKGFFHALLIASPVVAILLYFSLQGREEVRVDMRVQQAEQKVEAAKFDQEFAAAWNGGKLKGPSNAEVERLEQARDALTQERDALNASNKQDLADLRAAIEEAGKKEMGHEK